MHPLILASRANGDQDKLLTPLKPLLDHTAQAMQMHLIANFEHGTRFSIKGYLQHTIQRQLSMVMLAAHLAGIRRTDLNYSQSPKQDLQASLELSLFSGIIAYFRGRKDVNIKELQKTYNTVALEVVSRASEKIRTELSRTVQKLIEGGAHVREAKQVLGQKFEEYGMKPASKSQLETIFRTQTQIAYAAGKYNAERHDQHIYDAIWGYKYVTAGDDRVRPSHAILDGVTLPKGDKFWQTFYPPNGWNCRCQVIPLFEPATIVKPPKRLPDGILVRPDVGFSWSAGHIFSALGA